VPRSLVGSEVRNGKMLQATKVGGPATGEGENSEKEGGGIVIKLQFVSRFTGSYEVTFPLSDQSVVSKSCPEATEVPRGNGCFFRVRLSSNVRIERSWNIHSSAVFVRTQSSSDQPIPGVLLFLEVRRRVAKNRLFICKIAPGKGAPFAENRRKREDRRSAGERLQLPRKNSKFHRPGGH